MLKFCYTKHEVKRQKVNFNLIKYKQNCICLINISWVAKLRTPLGKADLENDKSVQLLFLCVTTDSMETVEGEIDFSINTDIESSNPA